MTTTRRIAFDLAADLNEAGIASDDLDMDAVEALFAAECERRGYEAVFGGAGLHREILAADWADTFDQGDYDAEVANAAWQAIHDAIGRHDIIEAGK